MLSKGFNESKLELIYNGIDISMYKDLKIKKNEEHIIGTVGRFDQSKGIDTLIISFKTILENFPNLKLEIIGKGCQELYYKELVTKLNLEKNVRFLGYLNPNDVLQHMTRWEIFILPARWEGLGMVLIEAGFLMLPIIATNVGGIPEIITNNVNGFLIKPDDPYEINTKVIELMRSKSKRIYMGQQSRIKVKEYFLIEDMVIKTEKLYEKIFDNK